MITAGVRLLVGFTFNCAVRGQQADVNLTGTWQIDFHDDNGVSHSSPQLVLKQEPDRLTGTFGKFDWPVIGAVDHNNVVFSFVAFGHEAGRQISDTVFYIGHRRLCGPPERAHEEPEGSRRLDGVETVSSSRRDLLFQAHADELRGVRYGGDSQEVEAGSQRAGNAGGGVLDHQRICSPGATPRPADTGQVRALQARNFAAPQQTAASKYCQTPAISSAGCTSWRALELTTAMR